MITLKVGNLYTTIMKKENKVKRLYDGAAYCNSCSNCPVVDYHPDQNVIKISDPAKPEKGYFTMTVEEYNTLLEHAKKI